MGRALGMSRLAAFAGDGPLLLGVHRGESAAAGAAHRGIVHVAFSFPWLGPSTTCFRTQTGKSGRSVASGGTYPDKWLSLQTACERNQKYRGLPCDDMVLR